MKYSLIALLAFGLYACADNVTVEVDASDDQDATHTLDQGFNNLVMPDMGKDQDLGAPKDDMSVSEWPQYSGAPCNVDGRAGRCLPTDSCDGVATAGHCPGPAGIRCCVTSCGAGDGAGLCTALSSCPGAPVTDECVGPETGCCGQSSQGTFYGG